MSLLSYFLSSGVGSEQDRINRYLATAINGDLSPTADDQLQLFSTDSIIVKNNTAYWYYTGNGQGDGQKDPDIVFGATKDLTAGEISEGWTKIDNSSAGKATPVIPLGAPGSWEDRQTFARTAIYDVEQNIFKHWYLGQQDSNGRVKVGYATSTDGLSWTKYPSNPIYTSPAPFANFIVFFAVYKETSSLYHAIACGNRNVNTIGAIYLTSTDGISWAEQQNPVYIGTGIRSVLSIRKYDSLYYLWCEYGFNDDYQDNIGGVPTDIRLYSTSNFITLTDLGSIYVYDEPNESGLMGANLFEYAGKYYCGYSYFKNQVKAVNLSLAEEPFMALRILESNKNFSNISNVNNIYPSYLKRYYPLYNKAQSQTPSERVNQEQATTTGTITWNNRKYVQFTGTQDISYPEYVPTDPTKFAIKARVSRSLTGTVNIMQQDDVSRGWVMYLVDGLLTVDLYQSNVLTKSYVTTTQIVKPPGVSDIHDEVSVGFIWNNGSLSLLFGDGIQVVTKTVDLAMTQIETGSNVVHFAKGNPTIDIRSACIFDEITENQWLNVIDL